LLDELLAAVEVVEALEVEELSAALLEDSSANAGTAVRAMAPAANRETRRRVIEK